MASHAIHRSLLGLVTAKTPVHLVDHVARRAITDTDITVAHLAFDLGLDVPLVVEVGVLRQLVQPYPRNLLPGVGKLKDPVQVGIRLDRFHEFVAIDAHADARDAGNGVPVVILVAIRAVDLVFDVKPVGKRDRLIGARASV
ncbi:MAG: hypothetical protein CL901_00125 [Dehalococcoidia bacterium]|nr:hypothetical protein [Dehalococcoidia bacterium]